MSWETLFEVVKPLQIEDRSDGGRGRSCFFDPDPEADDGVFVELRSYDSECSSGEEPQHRLWDQLAGRRVRIILQVEAQS